MREGRFGWRVTAGLVGCLTSTLAACGGLSPGELSDDAARAQTDFAGKDITLIVPNSPGEGMDTYARMIAPYIGECLGAQDIVVQNIVGAGGVKGTNTLWESEPDGLTFAFTSVPTIILADLADSEGVVFEADKLTYLGRAATEPRVLAVGGDSELEAADLPDLDREFVFPSQGTDEDFYTMAVLADSMGFPLQVVTGYEGNADTALAVVSGKADGHITAVSDAAPMIEEGDKKPIMMISTERVDDYPDVPTALDVVEGDDAKAVEAIVTAVELHRSFFGPPGMDEATTAKLRDAVTCALENEELQAKADEAELPLVPLGGAEEQEAVREVYANSQFLTPVLQRAIESLQ